MSLLFSFLGQWHVLSAFFQVIYFVSSLFQITNYAYSSFVSSLFRGLNYVVSGGPFPRTTTKHALPVWWRQKLWAWFRRVFHLNKIELIWNTYRVTRMITHTLAQTISYLRWFSRRRRECKRRAMRLWKGLDESHRSRCYVFPPWFGENRFSRKLSPGCVLCVIMLSCVLYILYLWKEAREEELSSTSHLNGGVRVQTLVLLACWPPLEKALYWRGKSLHIYHTSVRFPPANDPLTIIDARTTSDRNR